MTRGESNQWTDTVEREGDNLHTVKHRNNRITCPSYTPHITLVSILAIYIRVALQCTVAQKYTDKFQKKSHNIQP
jgi:hypothetical protein